MTAVSASAAVVNAARAADTARAIPRDAIVQEVVYCNQFDEGCADTTTAKSFPQPPRGHNGRLGCNWITTGYSSGLQVYKYFCIIRHGVALGSVDFAPQGEGWGTAHPLTIYNGGDPSGFVGKIRWQHWGKALATGRGLTAIFKPTGGFYPQRVPIELRASRIGRCTPHGPRAYRHLMVREPSRPGGPPGAWFVWSGKPDLCHGLAGSSDEPPR